VLVDEDFHQEQRAGFRSLLRPQSLESRPCCCVRGSPVPEPRSFSWVAFRYPIDARSAQGPGKHEPVTLGPCERHHRTAQGGLNTETRYLTTSGRRTRWRASIAGTSTSSDRLPLAKSVADIRTHLAVVTVGERVLIFGGVLPDSVRADPGDAVLVTLRGLDRDIHCACP
jgi:hypothetical protein